MYGFAVNVDHFAENVARGQGCLNIVVGTANVKKGDMFAFVVWPLDKESPVAYMRAFAGAVETEGLNTAIHWERIDTQVSEAESQSIAANLVRLDQPEKYD